MMETAPMPTCPMAETCKGMMEQRMSGLMLTLPGIAFILMGVAVLVEPRLLVWLVAIALLMVGIAMLTMAKFIRTIGEQFTSTQ